MFIDLPWILCSALLTLECAVVVTMVLRRRWPVYLLWAIPFILGVWFVFTGVMLEQGEAVFP